MPDPKLKYDREEMTITLEGIGTGWTLSQLGEFHILDSAQLQLPTWSEYKKAVALRIFESQWRLNSQLLIEQTLESGIDFTGADGVGQSISLDTELKYHIMNRPMVKVDLTFKYGLEGTFQRGSFEGLDNVFNLGLKVRF